MSEWHEPGFIQVPAFIAAMVDEYCQRGHTRYTTATLKAMREAERLLKIKYKQPIPTREIV